MILGCKWQILPSPATLPTVVSLMRLLIQMMHGPTFKTSHGADKPYDASSRFKTSPLVSIKHASGLSVSFYDHKSAAGFTNSIRDALCNSIVIMVSRLPL